MAETIWRRDENWVGSDIEDSFVMVNIETGKYVSLNATANAVWQALDEPRSQAAIEDHLIERFEVAPEHCRSAVSGLLEEMRGLQIASPA